MNPNTGDLVGHLSGDLRVRDRVERWFNRRYTASRRDTYLIRTDTGWQCSGERAARTVAKSRHNHEGTGFSWVAVGEWSR